MPGRQYNATNGYRYGFNGKEKDTEGPVQYDYGFRIYDPRLVRFKSVDPLSPSYPMLTPYQFASNRPTQAIDLDGLEAKDAQTGETLNQFGKTQLSKISEKDYAPWKDLLTLVTPKEVFTRANNRFYTHKFSDQKMTDASGDELNLDYYSLNIVKLPPSFKTAGELFEHVRQNFSDFKKGGGNDFEGFDQGENTKWKSNDPLSSIMRFKGYVGGVNLDDADVVTSHYSYSTDNAYWIFKPVEDYNYISNWTGFSDKGHPLAGYRQFGIIPNGEGGSTFYTRAVDMPYSFGDAIMSSAIFGGADKLWNAVIKNVTDYINKNGGSATANPVLSKRIQWSTDVSGADKTKVEDCGN